MPKNPWLCIVKKNVIDCFYFREAKETSICQIKPLLWILSRVKDFSLSCLPSEESHLRWCTRSSDVATREQKRFFGLQNRIKRFDWKVPTPRSYRNHPVIHIPLHPSCLNLQQKLLHRIQLLIIKGHREMRGPTTPFTFAVPNIGHPSFLGLSGCLVNQFNNWK